MAQSDDDPAQVLAEELEACRRAANPFDRFNSVVLQRAPYWRRQREVCRTLAEPNTRVVCVKSGHMVGKSFLAAGVGLGWLSMYPDSGVVILGPVIDQVRRAVWSEVRQARAGSPLLSAAGRLTRSPMNLEYDDGWLLIGMSGTEPERLQGFHPRGPVLAIVDEASGVNDPDVNQAIDSLKPVRKLLISNPLKAHGVFHGTCKRAEDDRTIRVIKIPSTDSPDIDLETSPRGLADATWHRNMILDYGRESQTYRVRVGAEFPDSSDDALIPDAWLDLCESAAHQSGGNRRISIDLGLGSGGDPSVIVARDDNGILAFDQSNAWNLETTASRASLMAQRFGIAPHRITWDAESIGADFENRLRQVNIVGCKPYRGKTTSGDPRFINLRGACLMALRWRLDPERRDRDGRKPPTFSIPREFMARFRREVREITHSPGNRGQTVVRTKEDVQKALGHSPDYSDTLAQSFAYPNT